MNVNVHYFIVNCWKTKSQIETVNGEGWNTVDYHWAGRNIVVLSWYDGLNTFHWVKRLSE